VTVKRIFPALAVFLLAAVASAQVAPRPYNPSSPDDPARSYDEAIAIRYIKTVQNAQAEYKKRNGRYAGSLSALVNHGSFTRRMARPDRPNYTVTFRGGASAYSVQMIPKTFDTARRSFYSDQTGVLRVADDEPATAESPALKADRETAASDQQ
jgi:hypothetical protein